MADPRQRGRHAWLGASIALLVMLGVSACDDKKAADTQPAPAQPPPPAPDAGVHTHDGFLLRASLGFGGGAMYESYRGDLFGTGEGSGEIERAGGGLRLAIDVGSALSPAFSPGDSRLAQPVHAPMLRRYTPIWGGTSRGGTTNA